MVVDREEVAVQIVIKEGKIKLKRNKKSVAGEFI